VEDQRRVDQNKRMQLILEPRWPAATSTLSSQNNNKSCFTCAPAHCDMLQPTRLWRSSNPHDWRRLRPRVHSGILSLRHPSQSPEGSERREGEQRPGKSKVGGQHLVSPRPTCLRTSSYSVWTSDAWALASYQISGGWRARDSLVGSCCVRVRQHGWQSGKDGLAVAGFRSAWAARR
jgi:hypothetical protein